MTTKKLTSRFICVLVALCWSAVALIVIDRLVPGVEEAGWLSVLSGLVIGCVWTMAYRRWDR